MHITSLAAAALAVAMLSSPKHTEQVASFGAPMAAAKPPAQTNWLGTLTWTNAPDTNIVGFVAYWGPKDNMTNRVDVGDAHTATIVFPKSAGVTWITAAAYDYQMKETFSPEQVHWPLYEAFIFTGSNLQCRASLTAGSWMSTNSPYCVTNPAGSMFFRSTDTNGPTIQKALTQ